MTTSRPRSRSAVISLIALLVLLTAAMAGCGRTSAGSGQKPTEPAPRSTTGTSGKNTAPEKSSERSGDLTDRPGRVPSTVGLERVERDAEGRLQVKGIAER